MNRLSISFALSQLAVSGLTSYLSWRLLSLSKSSSSASFCYCGVFQSYALGPILFFCLHILPILQTASAHDIAHNSNTQLFISLSTSPLHSLNTALQMWIVIWPPCAADADIIFLPCGFFLSSYGRGPPYGIGQAIIFLLCDFSFLSVCLSVFPSPNLSGRRLDVYHTSTHGVALVRI